MKIFYLIFIFISLYSCTVRKKEELENNEYKITHYKNDSIKHGKFKFYSDNRVMQRKMTYKNNLLHGRMTYYHSNGNRAGYYISKKDKLNGNFYFFHDNGKQKMTIIYINNKVNDVKNCYTNEGKLLNCGQMKKGDGFINQFNDEGKLLAKDYYLNGIYIKSDTIF